MRRSIAMFGRPGAVRPKSLETLNRPTLQGRVNVSPAGRAVPLSGGSRNRSHCGLMISTSARSAWTFPHLLVGSPIRQDRWWVVRYPRWSQSLGGWDHLRSINRALTAQRSRRQSETRPRLQRGVSARSSRKLALTAVRLPPIRRVLNASAAHAATTPNPGGAASAAIGLRRPLRGWMFPWRVQARHGSSHRLRARRSCFSRRHVNPAASHGAR